MKPHSCSFSRSSSALWQSRCFSSLSQQNPVLRLLLEAAETIPTCFLPPGCRDGRAITQPRKPGAEPAARLIPLPFLGRVSSALLRSGSGDVLQPAASLSMFGRVMTSHIPAVMDDCPHAGRRSTPALFKKSKTRVWGPTENL